MYFGSVRFFKHIILCATALIVLIPFVLCIVLGVRNSELKKQAAMLSSQIESIQGVQGSALETDGASPAEGYTALYPDMVCEKQMREPRQSKTVYLTFDDGPSARTEQILAILKEQGIQATFFVTANDQSDYAKGLLRKIVQEGHAIGVHSYSHDYKKVYASVEAYLEDFHQMYAYIQEIAGVQPTIFRFPGGSVNTYNMVVFPQLIAEMSRRGFVYFDWNAYGGDASQNATVTSIVDNVVGQVMELDTGVVLLHDSQDKRATVGGLDEIIDTLQARGYRFDKLSNRTSPVVFPGAD